MKRRYIILILAAVSVACAVPFYYYFFVRKSATWVDIDKNRFPITGIDISAHNGDIDFEQLAEDSIDFVMIKATEGTTFKDPRFHLNYRLARDAGIKAIGAYHFFRFDTDGEMQAINLLHSIQGKTLDLPVAIDLEEWTNPSHLNTNEVVDRLQAMISLLEKNGLTVIFYTNKDGYHRFIKNRFNNYPIWICSFSDPPMDNTDAPWTLWQYSHKGDAKGCTTCVDMNTFNGDREEWESWLNTSIF